MRSRKKVAFYWVIGLALAYLGSFILLSRVWNKNERSEDGVIYYTVFEEKMGAEDSFRGIYYPLIRLDEKLFGRRHDFNIRIIGDTDTPALGELHYISWLTICVWLLLAVGAVLLLVFVVRRSNRQE